jgi:hypothetical protein
MKRTLNLPLAIALFLMTAHRLPAPIQEIPERPSPTPSVASTPAVAPAPAVEQAKKPLSKPKSKSSGAARFAGTWIGRITADKAGDVDVTLIISAEGTSVNGSSKAGIWTRPLTYDGKQLSWQAGRTNKVAWTFTPNPDEQTALVTRTWSGIRSRAIFKRVHSAEAPSTMPVAQATKETQSSEASLPKGAVHLVINSDSDARKIFTYFVFPPTEAPPGTTGLYRLEVSPEGTVTAVTILKSMGSAMDVTSMKTFVKWRAEPGSLRIVDVGRKIVRIERVISR